MVALHDKVFYYPASTETGIIPDLSDQPFVAIVCLVHEIPPAPEPAIADTTAKDKAPQLVNLAIFDHRGITHGRQDVPILPDGKGERPCCTASYAKEKKKAESAPETTEAQPSAKPKAKPGPTAAGILGIDAKE
jgi:hypothetical protein